MINLILIFALLMQISSSTSISTPSPSGNSVKIYTGRRLTGESKTVEVSSCVSLLGDAFDDRIASIDTMGSCVILYSDYDCLGNESLAATFSPIHHHNTGYYGFTINSLGPCRANCTAPNYENGITRVTVSAESGAQVFNHFMVVTGECVNFPDSFSEGMGRISLLRPLCIQMYEDKACRGSSKRFQVFGKNNSISGIKSEDSKEADDEYLNSFAILPIKWQLSRSLSLCDFNCIGSINSSGFEILSSQTTPASSTVLPHVPSVHTSTSIKKYLFTHPTTTEHPEKVTPFPTSSVSNTELNPTVTNNILITKQSTQIPASSTGKTPITNGQKVVAPATHGHFLLWLIMVVVFVAIVTIAEVFRRYRNHKLHNTASNEFANLLILPNGQDYL